MHPVQKNISDHICSQLLKVHIQKYTSDHFCSQLQRYCNKKFSTSGNTKQHEKTHTGEKNFNKADKNKLKVYVKQEITILFFMKKLSNHSCTLHVINYQWKYDSQAHNYLCLCMCVSISKQSRYISTCYCILINNDLNNSLINEFNCV